MHITGSKASALVLIAALALLPVAGLAKDGRDFAGFYNVSNIVDQGDQLALTLKVHLFNYSDADLQQAVVTLRASQPVHTPLVKFQPVKLWRNRTEVKLTQQVILSRVEFERWQKGLQPALFVVYNDANGQHFERFAQLTRRPDVAR